MGAQTPLRPCAPPPGARSALAQALARAEKPAPSLPDPLPRWDSERKHYDFGPIHRSEFQAGPAGEGSRNRRRPARRDAAHRDGEWGRAAAQAHACARRSAPDDRAREVGLP